MKFFIKQKHRIKCLLIRVSGIIMSKPHMKTGCKKILSLFPGLYQRLSRIVKEGRISCPAPGSVDFFAASENEIVQNMPEPVYQSYRFIKNPKEINETEGKNHESCD